MGSLLLAIIYIAFISLGLPDGLLGAAWPVMFGEMNVPVSYAGLISMIISGGTIISSLFSDKLTSRIGTAKVTALSVMLTAGALFGFSQASSFSALCLLAIPYGLGAGAVDAALNNYVALHYTSRHMSWLHCFWGVGATVGPYIMGWAIGAQMGWRSGYGVVAIIQLILTIALFASMPLFKQKSGTQPGNADYEAPIGIIDAVKIRGVKSILLAFFCQCAVETATGLWTGTYLVEFRGMNEQVAATFTALSYVGITVGRFFSGFITERVGDKNMIRLGAVIMLAGAAMVALPVKSNAMACAGLIVIGLGSAPVYPSIIHATPAHFGRENTHAIVGIQMASAYTGSTLMPPVFGFIAQEISIALFPAFLGVLTGVMFLLTERVNRVTKAHHA